MYKTEEPSSLRRRLLFACPFSNSLDALGNDEEDEEEEVFSLSERCRSSEKLSLVSDENILPVLEAVGEDNGVDFSDSPL